jgi:hypothetical protein
MMDKAAGYKPAPIAGALIACSSVRSIDGKQVTGQSNDNKGWEIRGWLRK